MLTHPGQESPRVLREISKDVYLRDVHKRVCIAVKAPPTTLMTIHTSCLQCGGVLDNVHTHWADKTHPQSIHLRELLTSEGQGKAAAHSGISLWVVCLGSALSCCLYSRVGRYGPEGKVVS